MTVEGSSELAPDFSVVVATYRRDEAIIPTLESVTRQTHSNFEVLVVSDGEPSQGLERVIDLFDTRFSLHHVPERSRSQSVPNNLGWKKAKGRFIAYLGHDDVWAPNHLASLLDVFSATDSPDSPDFAVGGCLYLGPPGTGDQFTWVTGLFESKDVAAPTTYFFPPSSLAHRRSLPPQVPRWSDPLTTRRPVDTEFVVGAAESGCTFASTGQISVFKFASALRYLSYLCPDDQEQKEMLDIVLNQSELGEFIRSRVTASRQLGGYMAPRHAHPNEFSPGQKVRMNEVVRGINVPPVTELARPVRLDVGSDSRGFDWYPPEGSGDQMWRWSGPSHRPRLLLPLWSSGPVHCRLEILGFAAPDIRRSLQVFLNGRRVRHRLYRRRSGYCLGFRARLERDSPTVLELRMNRTAQASEIQSETADRRRLGLSLAGVELRPAALSVMSSLARTWASKEATSVRVTPG